MEPLALSLAKDIMILHWHRFLSALIPMIRNANINETFDMINLSVDSVSQDMSSISV